MSNIYILEPPTTGKVVMKTTVGDIDLELWTKEASKACRNFIQLCMEGYYDNTIFHRVVKGFIVQGGDPTGTGEGGESIYGEPFKDEFHTRLRFCRRGLLAMANSGKDDNGSQFFFTLAATPELQNKHTIFGKVTGETVFNMIKLEDVLVDKNDRPVYPQKILKTEILSNPFQDIVPRVLKKDILEEKTKKKDKKGVKDFKLLSFGEEAEEDEEESVVLSKQLGGKSKSAHDNLVDPKLSSEPVIASDGLLSKKIKKDNSDSESDSDSRSIEEQTIEDKEKREMTERIKNKLKDSKSSVFKKMQDDKDKDKDDNDLEEEYYLGKDRRDERKRQTEEIKKEIRNFKREIRKEQNKKLNDEKQKVEETKKKEIKSELIKEYHQTQEKYKNETSKIPKKGSSREDFTLQLLKKFKTKVSSAREQYLDKECSTIDNKKDEEISDADDLDDESWMVHALRCEDKTPVLAKDASTKGDDWFEIYDPRNPINKRRRGETSDKSKADRHIKSRR